MVSGRHLKEVKKKMGEEVLSMGMGANGSLVDVGERLARGDELERFVAGIIHPRYQLAGELVKAKFDLKEKAEEAGKKELNEVIAKIKEKRAQIEENPSQAPKLVKEIRELRSKQQELSKQVREAIKEERKREKEIKEAIKEKDTQAQIALVMLGYQL